MTQNGGTWEWFGPFILDVGCTPTSVTFADAGAMVTNVPIFVGDPITSKYTLVDPTRTRVWCEVQTNTIVNVDGTAWSGNDMVGSTQGCVSQPCNVFDLIDTDGPPDVIPFAIKTTFDNLFHVSAQITFTITCSNAYVLSEVAAPTNPQYVSHADNAVGYQIPLYTHDEVFGCPIDTYQVTNAAAGAVVQPTGIAAFGTADPAELVKPANTALHQSYVFYTKITSSDGGATGYFGPYTLWVGCTASTVSFTDSATFIDTTNIPVGDALTSAY